MTILLLMRFWWTKATNMSWSTQAKRTTGSRNEGLLSLNNPIQILSLVLLSEMAKLPSNPKQADNSLHYTPMSTWQGIQEIPQWAQGPKSGKTTKALMTRPLLKTTVRAPILSRQILRTQVTWWTKMCRSWYRDAWSPMMVFTQIAITQEKRTPKMWKYQ